MKRTGFGIVVLGWAIVSIHAHEGHNHSTSEPPMLLAFERRQPPNSADNWRATESLSNRVSITVEGNARVIRANGIPDHPAGTFPNRYNPNRISPQEHEFRVPLSPKMNRTATPIGMQPFGIAVNGVLFDPAAAEWWNGDRTSGWQYEPMNMPGRLGADENNAHVQPTGTYHYHSLPTGLLRARTSHHPMTLLGWAADGFPIYAPKGYADPGSTNSPLKTLRSSYRVKPGERPGGPGGKHDGTFVADYEYVKGSGDLDECNGRYGKTPEFPQGTYYYVITEQFPFIPRMLKGTADPSFQRKGPPRGHRREGGPSQGRPPDRRAHAGAVK